ncbi:glutamyl-tRNA reductase [Parasegetibacter sp. NRK P23]|uniref:glutamyl-tRNA reductase n=1 Tax=Parasegetibacter sp. NRK P23 TaxID=2942999 RepID=UPI002044977E|nr:glutamyl-tRNA reductase [Parasegetibacter sp. NRK P23]MCM5530197.1 glutamyl-tRNA reductase [Parasegetibacter sp. NRK P23]
MNNTSGNFAVLIQKEHCMGGSNKEISRFYVAGINYKKTDAAVRGRFAVNEEQYERILFKAKTMGIREVFILSTCNRTEIYGVAENIEDLAQLLCSETAGDYQLFTQLAYLRTGEDAINHIFRVASGLDSQILGDYEIVGQLKLAAKFAKQHGCIGTFLERLINQVLQSSKEIKNQTALSGGTVSVSFAAVQYIRENIPQVKGKRILLLGIGKIGRNTCKNLVDYLPATDIVLMNRSIEKAQALAETMQLSWAAFSDLDAEVEKADIILVATNAETPAILPIHLNGVGEKTIIDLSIPNNVAPEVATIPGITLVNVDELSKLKDETLQKREKEVPKAVRIIGKHQREFAEWVGMRQHVPVLKAVKEKLQEMQGHPIFAPVSAPVCCTTSEDKIQKVINVMATKMRRENQRGCHYIEAINDFITPGVH